MLVERVALAAEKDAASSNAAKAWLSATITEFKVEEGGVTVHGGFALFPDGSKDFIRSKTPSETIFSSGTVVSRDQFTRVTFPDGGILEMKKRRAEFTSPSKTRGWVVSRGRKSKWGLPSIALRPLRVESPRHNSVFEDFALSQKWQPLRVRAML